MKIIMRVVVVMNYCEIEDVKVKGTIVHLKQSTIDGTNFEIFNIPKMLS